MKYTLLILLFLSQLCYPQNSPPLTRAQYVTNSDSIILSASACDLDGTITSYKWEQIAGPAITTTQTATKHAKPGGKSYTLKPDAQGYLIVNSTIYKPGDTLYLSGVFKSVAIYNLSGVADNYITVTNRPGEKLVIGDSTWSGGAWAQGLIFRGCRYIEVAGTGNNFQIVGSNSTKTDANGYPVRTAYFDLVIGDLSDNFVVHDLAIRYGGAGLWAKSEVIASKPATWGPNTLNNFDFYNLDISGTYNEGMYIGHTATYWNIKTNQPYYPGLGSTIQNDTTTYKRPVKLRNVAIHDNYLHDIGNDGIQTAAIDNLELFNNEITNWATKKGMADNGGILIGGRVKGFSVYNNYVHDGWGELMQVYAEGGGPATITNNLLQGNKLDGVSFRGTDNLVVDFNNNTVARAGGNLLRVNGYYGGGRVSMNKNILAEPLGGAGTPTAKNYIYLENGGVAADNDNKKLPTATDITAASSAGYGYRYPLNTPPQPAPTVIVSPGLATTVVRGLRAGTYVFRLTVTDDKGGIASDEVEVVVR